MDCGGSALTASDTAKQMLMYDVVVDNAFNYFRNKGRIGKHCTIQASPSQVGRPSLKELKASNRQPELEMLNGQNGNLKEDYDPWQTVILLWTAADEAKIKRLAEAYEDHFSRLSMISEQSQMRYLANLAYTLSNRRSNLPWKTFSVIKNIEHLRTGLASALSKPIRSSASLSISFVFTGQSAQ